MFSSVSGILGLELSQGTGISKETQKLCCLCFQFPTSSRIQASSLLNSGSSPLPFLTCLHQLQGCDSGLVLSVPLRAQGCVCMGKVTGLACRVESLASELRLINPRDDRSKQVSGRFRELGPRLQN